MRRTEQEFKNELFRREQEYRTRQKKRRRAAVNTALCLVLVLCAGIVVLPFLGGMGGSTETADSMYADNGMMAEGAESPGAAEGKLEYGVAGSSAEPQDVCPAVMIDGVLYFDTGEINNDPRKCGTMDGEITSRVDGSTIPVMDDQSNFGVGYGYQYGATEGTVEIYINGKWCIFAAEE